MKIAKRMIQVAKESGADCCKFQTYKTDAICRRDSSQYDWLKRCELSYDQFRELSTYCWEADIEFMSTPDTVEDAIFLETLGMRYMKIGSANANDAFLDSLEEARIRTTLLISMGMNASLAKRRHNRAKHLYCVSGYPVPDDQINIRHMASANFSGLSDHTTGSVAAIMAVTMGAEIIEKHFTLDRTLEGPDHHMSMEPDELCQYVKDIRRAEKMLGDGVRRMMPCEEATRKLLAERR